MEVQSKNVYDQRFYQILGWRDETNTETFTIITLITVTLILIGFWKIIRNKNKEITFLSLFTAAQLTLSFIILQTRWDQPRITLVCMPIILILMFYAIYDFTIKPGIGQTIYIILLLFYA